MSSKVWKVGPGGSTPVGELESLCHVLLEQRGISVEDSSRFFEPQYDRDIHDPMLLGDMEVAVERVRQAIKKGQHIVVYGDYDADGVTGTAVVVSALRVLGAHVVPYLPHRLDEGYGLNAHSLRSLVSEFDLLITVDCGISNAEEIAWLRRKSKDVIVVDHHSVPSVLPDALAILHPLVGRRLSKRGKQRASVSYPFPHLSGAGVGWKFACALLQSHFQDRVVAREHELRLLDLACLGTLADMVPLVGENRALVTFGLRVLRRTKRAGLRLLLESTGALSGELSVDHVSFRLIPTLNAAGRLDHAQPALDLLLHDDEQAAHLLVAQLRSFNTARQSLSRRILQEAEAQLDETIPFIFVSDPAWQPGVLGLIAGRLSERWGRPAIVIGGHNGSAVGSARSPVSVNILEFLSGAQKHLHKVGGHARAAGFSLSADRVEQFKRSLMREAVDTPASLAVQEIYADAVLDQRLMTSDTVDLLERFAPHGIGNTKPTFVGRGFQLDTWRPVGRSRDHAKCMFFVGDRRVDGIGFGLASCFEKLREGMVDALFHLEINEFRGMRTLQVQLRDVVPAGSVRIAHAAVGVS